MKKNNLLDFLIVLLVFISLSCFPLEYLFPNSKLLVYIFRIVLQIGALIFIQIYVKKRTKLETKIGPSNKKNIILLIPTFLICFSNFAYVFLKNSDINPSFTYFSILEIILYVFVAINEETIFRFLLISNLETKNTFLKVIISSSIFALCHLTSFLSTFNFGDLLIVGYTFVLGIFLAIAFILSKSIMPIFIHFCFNVFNKVVFEALIPQISDYTLYIVSNIVVGSIVGLYVLFLLFINYKKIKKTSEISTSEC